MKKEMEEKEYFETRREIDGVPIFGVKREQ